MWDSIKIKDFGMVMTGTTPPSKKPEQFGEDHPFITPSDMDNSRRVVTQRGISAKGATVHSRKLLPKDSVCFVCIGATIGKICMTTSKSLTNQQINSIIVDKSKHDPFFVYYLLSTYSNTVKSIAGGAATPIANKTSFENINAIAPPLPVQHRIASILSAYDDLIENNTRRILILEEMAQRIYTEWFVHFRFPGHEGVKMVDSELGRIPSGWRVNKVGEVLKKVKRRRKIKKSEYQSEGYIPVVDQGKDFIGGYTDDIESLNADPLPIIVFGDHTRILKYIDFAYASGADGTQLLLANTDRLPTSLFYQTLKLIDLSDYAYARHFKFLKDKKIIVPHLDTAKLYSNVTDPIMSQITYLRKKNKMLGNMRDLLLPKLISGEIDVSEMPDAEEVAAA